MAKVHNTPSSVAAESGEVHVDGPDGVAVALTPDAAEETADRLVSGAAEAAGQNVEKRWKDNERAARHPEERRS
ncbi:hypothetical protein ACMGDM_19940 [Sphingomonas sp. DT-51]|uniref:hypothetical protein n=1 Tax=Sphingomonas sp. DT-51 TaxID=3396165 RepID=UPI003F1A7FC1